jgi:hypothetical protein
MRAAGVPTPAWAPIRPGAIPEPDFPPPYIVKSVWEHASIGLTGTSVAPDRPALEQELRRRAGRELFVEAYVEGREFNLALLEEAGRQPQVLPPAEIQFQSFPEGKPRIVDYAAKWESGSMEFAQTPRRFDFPDGDRELLERLRELALRCWRLFRLRGYARVDFRVDLEGRPWVLEVNTNPCLSPDAGFWPPPPGRAVPDGGGPPHRGGCPLASQTPALSYRAKSGPRTGRRSAPSWNPPDSSIPRRTVAVELVEERLQRGLSSGYHFESRRARRAPAGYTCYGPIACTQAATTCIDRASGALALRLGRRLLARAEEHIRSLGGQRIYVRPPRGPSTAPPGPSTLPAATAWRPSWRISTRRGTGRRSS